MDKVTGLFIIVAILFIIGVFTLLPYDFYTDMASQDEQIACEQKRMTPRRKYFSTTVICVPAITRNDTLTVH
jgi:hypothetical protein